MKLSAWLSDALTRHYPATAAKTCSRMTLDIAANERFQFQVAVRASGCEVADIRLQADAPRGWAIRIRRVGYVPVAHFNTPVMPEDADMDGRGHLPGLAPDPLFEESTLRAGQDETHAFWITATPSRRVTPGPHPIRLVAGIHNGPERTLILTANVSPVRIPRRQDFPVTNWFYIDTLMDRYRLSLRDERFWTILDAYLRNLTEHGQDTVYTSVFSVQLDGERTPSQLLGITRKGRDRYAFDWQAVGRFVETARRAGLRNYEWSHFFSQWGVRHALRIYEGHGETGRLLWPRETAADAPAYRRFLQQFLPEFHRFLAHERLLNRSFFHVSDEPVAENIENYRRARALLGELAPWMKVMDAMSDVNVAACTDMPVAGISHALQFLDAGMDAWCYFCCAPRERFLNRLMDTPLAKIRMSGWLFYRWPFRGFLHWGYNYWNRFQRNEMIDPFTVSDGGAWPGWAYGDTFLVYPGPDGPIDSIRWEVFADSLQDYALLQGSGVSRDDRMLSACHSFEDFPKTTAWIRHTRRKLLLTR